MNNFRSMILTIALPLTAAGAASAQTPARSADPPRSDPSRSVTLSLTEYNRLVDLASRPPQAPAVAPVDAVLASADLRVRVDRDAAHGVYTLSGDVLRTGLSRVNLISGATVLEASADGRPLPLLADGNVHAALLPGPGPFAVTLEWGAPLKFAPGRASFALPVPPAGTAHATLDLPGEQADVHLSAGVITRRSATGGRTVADITLRPGTIAEVWWSMRDSAPVAATREVRMLADTFTLVTVGDADVRMAALVDLTVVQGEPRTIEVRLPGGYDVTGISGSGIESSEPRDNGVTLTVNDPAARRHQFLVSLERAHAGGSFTLDSDFVALPGAQRERGEIAVEGAGALDLTAVERPGMHRIDIRELNPALQSLARQPILSAYRYQRTAGAHVALSMDVQRFADAGVLAAVADHAVATTLMTTEGRALTEVVLSVRNRAQAFLKVTLPPGATIVSVDVAGESAKPVMGADGVRVPLLRTGFRPAGAYSVSFVYLHAAAPLARKGELQMALPKMDMPVGLVEWEVFVPDRYAAEAVGGNVLDRRLVPEAKDQESDRVGVAGGIGGGVGVGLGRGMAGDTARTVPDGVQETVTVTGSTPAASPPPPAAPPVAAPVAAPASKAEPSQNVVNLQRRTAGVLPIRIDVPRAGTSHQFVKPLVVNQEAAVVLRYKRK